MIPNPIHKVLSTFQSCGLRALLMGGQACVFYGAAEFSRDTDFALQAEPDNLERLNAPCANCRPRSSPYRHSRWSIFDADTPFIFAAGTPTPPDCEWM